MRITVIANPFLCIPPNAIGAVEICWFNVVKEFKNMGHTVCMYGKGDYISRDDEIIYVKGYSQSRFFLLNLLKIFLFNFSILSKMKKTDILVVNNILGPIIPILFKWKYKKLIYNAARTPKKFFMFFRWLDGVCCPSTPISIIARQMLPNPVASKVKTIPNPVLTEVFYKHKQSIKHDSYIRVGFHGRVHPEKGLHLLAKAVYELLSEFPNLKVRIIGTIDKAQGGGGEEYKKQLNEILPNRIEWIAPLSNRNELAQSIDECDIYCYPSLADVGETFGVSPLEAMGLGKPIIVSSLPCFFDFVKNEFNGMVFNHKLPSAEKELMLKIRELILDPLKAKRIGDNAAVSAKNYSNRNVAGIYLDWFSEIMEK